MKKKILGILIILCAVVFCYAAAQLIRIFSQYGHNREVQEEIQGIFFQEDSEEPEEVSRSEENTENSLEETIRIPKYDFRPLLKKNPDVRGWLLMPAASVNNAVVQAEDNEYYLHTNLYGDYEFAGTLFIDYRCEENGRNTVIYGHNMLDGSMFGTIDVYLKEETGLENPSFWYLTPDQVYRCEIFSTYLTTVYEPYLRIDFADDEEYLDYIETIREQSLYEFPEVEIGAQDRILSLSTCNYTEVNKAGRQVIHALMVPV